MERQTKYYLGGYYLIRLRPFNFGSEIGTNVFTCSGCINDNLVDSWSYTWTTDNDKEIGVVKENLKLTNDNIAVIRIWVDERHNDNRLGWLNVFTDLESAIEYRTKFFSHLNDIHIFSLYFDENEANDLMKKFKPQTEKSGEIGLRLTLLKQTEEIEIKGEIDLGYDFVGIELGGSFHTFHCHDLSNELSMKFGAKTNKYGLFDNSNNLNQILDYLNDEENGCEPVPWYKTKVKLVTV